MIVDGHHQLERARVKEVSDEHARRIAENRVGRVVAAAQRGFVDDIVVQQRRGMDHFDHRRERMLMRIAIAAGLGDQQQQRRTQPLAASGDDVVCDPADQRHVGVQRVAQDLVDGLQVVAQGLLQQRNGHVVAAESGRGGGPESAVAKRAGAGR